MYDHTMEFKGWKSHPKTYDNDVVKNIQAFKTKTVPLIFQRSWVSFKINFPGIN